jgi:hypothetical protein
MLKPALARAGSHNPAQVQLWAGPMSFLSLNDRTRRGLAVRRSMHILAQSRGL